MKNINHCTLREEILADFTKTRQKRAKNEVYIQPPKFLPASFDFFLNRQN